MCLLKCEVRNPTLLMKSPDTFSCLYLLLMHYLVVAKLLAAYLT